MPLITKTNDKGESFTFDAALKTIDDGLAFSLSQLSSLESKIYETKRRNIVYQEFVPVDNSDPEWVDEISYISYDAVTSGKFIGASASDLPQSDINGSKSTIKVEYAGNSFGYSLDELRKSQAMNLPLDTTKGSVAFRGYQEHCQRLAFFGDVERGMYGLYNNPNIQTDNATITDWVAATGAQIVAEMNSLLTKTWQNSAESHIPDVFVLPSDRFALVSEKRMDSGTDTTVLEYFKKNNLFTSLTGQPLTVKTSFEAKTAGVDGVERMMCYELNDENLVMKTPMPFRMTEPQKKGLSIIVNCEYKTGGVEFRYPGCAAYRDFV